MVFDADGVDVDCVAVISVVFVIVVSNAVDISVGIFVGGVDIVITGGVAVVDVVYNIGIYGLCCCY